MKRHELFIIRACLALMLALAFAMCWVLLDAAYRNVR